MVSTEGSQHYISQSTPLAIDIHQSYPQDFFRLRINSNEPTLDLNNLITIVIISQ